MVFSTTNLFKNIACPEGANCTLTSCIFAHDLRPQKAAPVATPSSQSSYVASPAEPNDAEPAAKRRRVAYEKLEDKPPSKAELIRSQLAKERSKPTIAKPDPVNTVPSSLTRAVSPPPKLIGKATSSQAVAANKSTPISTITKPATTKSNITLNPRIVPNDPAGHAKRTLYLKHLHGEMARLNQLVVDRSKTGTVQFKIGLMLDEIELIQLALDEEEKLVREHSTVYGNVVKNRLAAYKKMKADDWIMHLKTTSLFTNKNAPVTTRQPGAPDPPKVIETGLSSAEELAVLSHLVIKDQLPLAKFGYVPTPPTAEQAAEAAAAVEASRNYEICDRCSSRFQIFPNRSEEGLLASNGPCRHHPNRKIFPQRTKADTGPKEAYYPCCNEVVGRPGCTETENHVFKASSPARLAAVLPFIWTPEHADVEPVRTKSGKRVGAVAYDCEMGHTTLGMELIRLTAVSWPLGEELVDVLVRPLGIVLDLNSRFSGVWPEDMADAVPYEESKDATTTSADGRELNPGSGPAARPALRIVESPQAARALLCSYLTPSTPLIGHAIENDLNATRLCHPTVVDTVIAYPHSRGLPMRYGLKMLSQKHLGRAIQQAGARGHDSLEDARATGDLVRARVGVVWKGLRGTGWKFEDGALVAPVAAPVGERVVGMKRKNELVDGSADSDVDMGNGLKGFLERGLGEERVKEEGGGEKHKLSAAYLEDDVV